MEKPWIYIASPYTNGDQAINTHFQCRIFNELMDDGIVWPVAPLWSHFQHLLMPRPYEDWLKYDMALIRRLDACLRLTAKHGQYNITESAGADNEVAEFILLGKPVFYDKNTLYSWVKLRCDGS